MSDKRLLQRLIRVEKALNTQKGNEYAFNGEIWRTARTIYGDKVATILHARTPYRPFILLTKRELKALLGKENTGGYAEVFTRVFSNTPEFWQQRLTERGL